MKLSRAQTDGAAVAAFALAMVVMLWIARANNFGVAGHSPFWPATGLYLGAALRCRRRLLPALAAVALAIWMLFPVVTHDPRHPPVAALLPWFGNTLAIMCGVLICHRIKRLPDAFGNRSSGQALRLLAILALCVPAIGATVMKLVGWALALEPQASTHWVALFEADGLGNLVVAPFVLALTEPANWRAAFARPPTWRPALILLAVLAASLMLFQGVVLPAVTARSFVIFPVLVLAAFQGERILSATATFIVALVVIMATAQGHGPFAVAGRPMEFIIGEVQTFLAATTLTSILLTDAVIARRTLAEEVGHMMQAKEQLLMDVSHELKSPLARMKMAVSFVKDAKVQAHLARDVGEMERMVAELLESARLKSPHGALCRATTDLAALVRDVARPYAAQRPGLELHSPPALDANVDGPRLAIVTRNLIDNALKYSDPTDGAVQVDLAADDRGVTLTVRDFGIGIPREDIPHLFEPFYRVDKSRSKASGGHGLGLSLCHRIVSAHGGSIVVAPEAKGTRVSVVLPTTESGA